MAKKQKEKSNEEKEQELRQAYLELQLMGQQLKQLQQQIQHIDAQVEELIHTEAALDEIPNAEKGSEMLAPLASGIFLKTKLDENRKVVLNIGAGTAVEKTIEETKKLVTDQRVEIMKVREQLAKQFESMSAQVQTMQLMME
ncbi:prefoldin subunit alpha [Candidatus Woesearchaeota archaeon]|nr:prefoldin subunit alpha [Candidatus Woesearchaeota archaeon]MBW3017592.1 prefoldin subunit alpha [Candidatus Woesearchaeota archaeon]